MAAAAPNSVGALTANSFGGDNTPSSCLDDPNFATICSFIQNFGEIIRIGRIPFDDLQQMLENSADAPPPLVQLHITLLRRVFKTVTPDKWERSLAKFGHTYCSQDAWEIERFGYKKAKIQTKLRLLKNLLEAQFDFNVKFKAEVNKLQAADLRLTPLGRDTEGQVYWYQVDEDANLRVYREDIDDETWEIVASNRDELEDLISQLQRGEVKKPEPEETIVVPEEDSNSKDDIEPKEIILDTGKVEDDVSNAENSSESDERDDGKEDKRTVEPLIIKHSFNINRIRTGEVENVRSDIDDVKYEINESDPKATGLKMVFGLKSRPKVDKNAEPNLDVTHTEIKETPQEIPVTSAVVEEALSIKLSVSTKAAPPTLSQATIVPKPEPSEVIPPIPHVEETKVARSEVPAKIPTLTEKPLTTTDVPAKIPTLTDNPLSTTNVPAKIPTPTEKPLSTTNVPAKTPTLTEKPLSTTNVPAKIPTLTEKPLSTTNVPAKTPIVTEKPLSTTNVETKDVIKISSTLNNELAAKAEKREVQTKVSKNLQKSAKVNSIVERLNKNLPENSAKTVADLLPPPEIKKSYMVNLQQSQDNDNLSAIRKSKVEAALLSKDNTVSVAKVDDAANSSASQHGSIDLSAKIQRSKPIDLTNTRSGAVSDPQGKFAQVSHEKNKISLTEKVNQPPPASEDTQQPIIKDVEIKATKKSVTSITSEIYSSSQNVTVEKPKIEPQVLTFGATTGAGGNTTVPNSKSIPKDNGTKMTVPNPQEVPRRGNDTLVPTVPVVEESCEKKTAWVCGKEETLVEEKAAVKESEAVCEKEAPPVEEKAVVKKSAWVCGKEATPVEEKVVTKESAWVCGNDKTPIEEKLVVKESAWVCGKSEQTTTVKSDSGVKEDLPKVFPSPSQSDLDIPSVVSEPPVKTTSVLAPSAVSDLQQSPPDERSPVTSTTVKEKNETIVAEPTKNDPTNEDFKVTPSPISAKLDNTEIITPKEAVADNVEIDHNAPKDFPAANTMDDKVPESMIPPIPPPQSPPKVNVMETEEISSEIQPLCIDESATGVTTGEAESLVVQEEKSLEIKPVASGTLTPDSGVKSQNSVKSTVVDETVGETKPKESHDPPAVIGAEKSTEESNLVKTPCLPTAAVAETNIIEPVPVQSLPSPKVEERLHQGLTDQDNKDTVELCEKNNASDKTEISDNDKSSETEKEATNESSPVSGKPNSSLVSALYSESSESSNEAFTVNTPKENANVEPQLSAIVKDITSVSEATSAEEANTNAQSDIDSKDQKETTSVLISRSNTETDTKDIQNVGAKGDQDNIPPSDLNNPDLAHETKEKVLEQSLALECTNTSGKVEASSTNVVQENVNNKSLEMMKDCVKQTEDNAGVLSDQASAPEATSSKEADDVLTASAGTKRKAADEVESLSKLRKLEDIPAVIQKDTNASAIQVPVNPIVGETVEEEVMTITGEGSGAMNEGRNSPAMFNPICGETIEEEVMTITGVGFGVMNEGSNENSPVSLAVADVAGSQNESIESDESRDTFSAFRGRGGRRGRGRRGRPPAGAAGGRSSQPSTTPRNNSRGGSRGSREVARLGVSADSVEVNGDNERPVRASRRIAQIRLKEEEERRKLEEERLAQLKAAQMQKKAKQEEREKNKDENQSPALKMKKGPGRKSQKNQIQFATEYLPSGSESEDNSEEGEASDEFSEKVGKGGKRRKRRKNGKNGKAKKGGNPWATSDEDEEEEQVEEEEEYHYEEEEEELVFKSDHEFSPESDLGEDDDAGPSRHARTAKQDKGDLFEEGNCCKCGKGDHPEWILLCDKCDKGWHASCLRPQLWVIPEGEWFCPPCQHNMLIENLSKNLVEYEGLLKRRENEILRKQRLAYVGISLDNVLPDKEPEAPEPDQDQEEKVERDKKRQRRRILSDEELSDFINDNDSDDDLSRSRSGSSDDSDEPVYRLRARRSKKAFDFKEYDDMINSALRVDDDEEGVEIEKNDQEEDEEDDEEGDKKLNGEDKDEEDDHDGVGGGKNDAYLKHLERQAQEEDETDEELLDEKERLRRKELKKQGQRKTRRRINDLDAYSEEEDSDDDFKASEAEDEDEELAEEGESEWSGDKMEDDSDDSIAKRARRKDRQGRHGRLGRREKYSDKGLVRRSTRKRRSRISYDESDDDDEEEEDQNDKWQSEESEEEEESESNSESDDATWGKRKKKGFAAAKPKLSSFVLGAPSSSKGKGKGGVKRKRRKTDDDDVDRAWNSARGKRDKDEPIERRTRGRKINFKDILDSGESDDDGNVRPKRRPLSDSEDSRSPSSSRRLAEEIRAENARKAKEYEESQAKMVTSSGGVTPEQTSTEESVSTKDVEKNVAPLVAPAMPESLTVAKLAESSVNKIALASTSPKIPPSPVPQQLLAHLSATHPIPPPINNLPPLPVIPSPPAMAVVSATTPLQIPPNSSPLLLSTPTPPMSLPTTIGSVATSKRSGSPSALPKSPPPIPFIPKSVPSNLSVGHIPPNLHTGPIPGLSIPPGPPITSAGPLPQNLTIGHVPPIPPVGSSSKSNISPIPPPVPVPILTEKKSKQPKGSRGSRGSKSEKQAPPPLPVPPPSDLELALSKPVKNSPLGIALSKSSSKKKDRDRDREGPVSVPNPSLLMAGAGGVLPELLGMGLPSSIRHGAGIPGSTGPPSGSSSSKKSKSSGSSSRTTQQTTPPPVSQNLSPSLPIDIDRVPNPALFQGNPGMRPFHPMWAVRNPGPPPSGYSPSGSPVPASLGKPPPLNTSPFSGQQGPPPRPGFPSPPPLRIPNPNTSPLQAFQHFKRDGPLGGPLYRLPSGQGQPGVPLPNILPPGMMSPHAGGPERFFGAPSGYPHPYGLLPPHSQGPPQALFPYDYRPPEPPFKEEPAPPRTTASSLPTPVSSASSSPPPTTSASVPLPTKDEGSAARDSEFGGLVSYFSSQRSEEDMDT